MEASPRTVIIVLFMPFFFRIVKLLMVCACRPLVNIGRRACREAPDDNAGPPAGPAPLPAAVERFAAASAALAAAAGQRTARTCALQALLGTPAVAAEVEGRALRQLAAHEWLHESLLLQAGNPGPAVLVSPEVLVPLPSPFSVSLFCSLGLAIVLWVAVIVRCHRSALMIRKPGLLVRRLHGGYVEASATQRELVFLWAATHGTAHRVMMAVHRAVS